LEVPLVKLSGTIVDRRSARNAIATGHSNDTAVPTLFTRALVSSRLPVSSSRPNFRRASSREPASVGISLYEPQDISRWGSTSMPTRNVSKNSRLCSRPRCLVTQASVQPSEYRTGRRNSDDHREWDDKVAPAHSRSFSHRPRSRAAPALAGGGSDLNPLDL
jgi:hypothetical protein